MVERSLEFFDQAYQDFLEASFKTGEVRQFFEMAGRTFCVRFAGGSMVDLLTMALRHLEAEESKEPDLTICVWNSASLRVPWGADSYALRGEVIGYDSERVHTVVDIHTKVLHLFDKERKIALYWIEEASRLPWWIGGSPFQLILHWWMRENGHQLTHAAVVGHSEGGVLLTGKSGSGKSTTALACMRVGMKYVSEDYCLVSDLPEVWAHSVYNSAKIEEKTFNWFSELGARVENIDREKGDKALLFHHKFQPEKILSSCPLKAIVTLKIETEKETGLEPVDPHTALTSLSVSTIWQLTHTGLPVLNHFKRLIEAIPCYRLHLGSDFMRAPGLLEALL